uniref:Poly(A) RNA polymerase mitochondrial-like central palm domain-containing protein n=1 Tax=Panagrolaimus davidi TaxID=227884 RepID=A0A914Q3J9_9BILA
MVMANNFFVKPEPSLIETVRKWQITQEEIDQRNNIITMLNGIKFYFNKEELPEWIQTGSFVATLATKDSDLDLCLNGYKFIRVANANIEKQFHKKNALKRNMVIQLFHQLNKHFQNDPNSSKAECRPGYAPIVYWNYNNLEVDFNPSDACLPLNQLITTFLDNKDKERMFQIGLKVLFKNFDCLGNIKNFLSSSALMVTGICFLKTNGNGEQDVNELIRSFAKFFLNFDFKNDAFSFDGILERSSLLYNDTSGIGAEVVAYDHFARHNLARKCSQTGIYITKMLCNLILRVSLAACF